jgi:hypothetical protein
MRLQVRFERAPHAELRRVLAARFRLVAGGGGLWRWRGAVARFSARGELDGALAALDALLPIREVDRGAGFTPFARVEERADGLDLVARPDAARPAPPAVPAAVRARFVFDDHVLAAPGGRYVAFVRDARRCHFQTLHVVDTAGHGSPIELPAIHDYPRTAFSPDGARLLIGGPLDVLEADLAGGRLTTLHHDDAADGFDVCYLGPRRAAAIGWHALTVYSLDGDRPPRRVPCTGGRLVCALLEGRVLLAGTADGTFALGIRGDALRLLAHDWRTLDAAWHDGGRVWCAPAGDGVHEVRGLDEAWARGFTDGGDQPELTLCR